MQDDNSSDTDGVKSGLSSPKKVTVIWLLRHVPALLWISALGIFGASYVAGVKSSELSFVRQIFGLPDTIPVTEVESNYMHKENIHADYVSKDEYEEQLGKSIKLTEDLIDVQEKLSKERERASNLEKNNTEQKKRLKQYTDVPQQLTRKMSLPSSWIVNELGVTVKIVKYRVVSPHQVWLEIKLPDSQMFKDAPRSKKSWQFRTKGNIFALTYEGIFKNPYHARFVIQRIGQ